MPSTTELWQPSASISHLRERARIIQQIRGFFADRDVLEVDTPLLCRTVNSDPYVSAFVCKESPAFFNQVTYLQTSPEFAMKRLLAAGSGAIYQIGKAFRQDDSGRLHNPEFTIMEWYRPGFDHHQLMDEMSELITLIANVSDIPRMTYLDLFMHYAHLNPYTASLDEIKACVKQQGAEFNFDDLPRDSWLDMVMTHVIEPQLKDTWMFVYDFPASQAALAKIRPGPIPVGERFELYAYGIELANGFHELTDADEQRQRFVQDNENRKIQGLPLLPIDEQLIDALRAGMPDCAGVALGVDRLIMLALKASKLGDVLSFTAEKV